MTKGEYTLLKELEIESCQPSPYFRSKKPERYEPAKPDMRHWRFRKPERIEKLLALAEKASRHA